jgi:PAS domain S-box-containing protein
MGSQEKYLFFLPYCDIDLDGNLAMVVPPFGTWSDGLAAGALFLYSTFLALLAWRGKDGSKRRSLAFAAAASFLLGLSHTLMAMGVHGPRFRFLAVLAGLVSVLLLMSGLPGWLQTRSGSDTSVLVEEKEQALGRLRKTEAHLGILVEEVREYAIFQLDAEGRVASWNLGAERIKGWRAEEVLGQPHAVFYSEEELLAGKPEQDLEEVRKKGSLHRETWRVRQDGRRFMASMLLTALHEDGAQVTGFIDVTRDITERLVAEQRQQAQALDLEAQMAVRTAELQESEARLQGFTLLPWKHLDLWATAPSQKPANHREVSCVPHCLFCMATLAIPGICLETVEPPW